MASGLLSTYLGEGLAASRPASPNTGSAIAFWWSTDTDELSAWLENAWVEDILAGGGGGGSLADGDYGDVTVSGSGTAIAIDSNAVSTAKIAADAVTFAKMQDASATKRVVGRNTAGTGDFEEVTIEQLFSWIAGTPAQGDIFYRDASGVARLAAGTSGQKLKTLGSGANPVWADGSGTSFPGSPATNDRFYRTDRNIEYFYDGTRWLSTQLIQVGSWQQGQTATFSAYMPIATVDQYDIYLERIQVHSQLTSATTGTNYYTIQFATVTGAVSVTNVGTSMSTQSDTQNNIVIRAQTIGSVIDMTSSQVGIAAAVTRVASATGNLNLTIGYRLVG